MSAMASGTTLPQLLRRNAERMPERPALREKDRGIWQTYTWRRYCDEVRDFALGLAARRLRPRRQAVGDRREPARLYFAQLAAMSLGGIAVPVYQDAIASELAYVLEHAETSVDRRRGPGAGRQDPGAAGRAAAPEAARL